MIRWLKEFFTTAPAAPVHQPRRGENSKPLSAITQNCILGAHIAHAGRFTRGRR